MTFVDALGAAKGAYELVAVAIKARDDAKVQSAMADLREKLWEMSTNGLSQIQELHRLELEVQQARMQLMEAQRANADLKAQIEDKAQYQLTEVTAGVWAQVLKDDIQKPVKSRPNFCAACYDTGRKIPLQYREASAGVPNRLTCPVEKEHRLDLGGALPVRPNPFSGRVL